MRVMVFAKATEGSEVGDPTPEQLEAFAAMDRFTEELVKAGVFVAAAGLKNGAQAKRIVSDGASRTVIDGPFAESRELVVGFSIWEVKDMDEAMAWAKRAPNPCRHEERDGNPAVLRGGGLAEFVTPEELAAPREGSAGSSASPDSRLVAGLSRLRPWPKMRGDRRRDAPGDRSDLSH